MSLKSKIHVLMMLFTFFLAACSSSGTYTVKQAMTEPISRDKSVSIQVKADKITEQDEEVQNVISALRERLFARLVSEGMFKGSVMHPNKAEYNLEVNVSEIRIVSNAARIAFGVMAGPSSIETEVLLKDSTSNKILTAFNVQGKSAAHPLSSETGYENAVRETANNIVEALRK